MRRTFLARLVLLSSFLVSAACGMPQDFSPESAVAAPFYPDAADPSMPPSGAPPRQPESAASLPVLPEKPAEAPIATPVAPATPEVPAAPVEPAAPVAPVPPAVPIPSTPVAVPSAPSPAFDDSLWLHTYARSPATYKTDKKLPGLYRKDGTLWMGRGGVITDPRGCDGCSMQDPDPTQAMRRIDYLVDEQHVNIIRLMLMSFDSPTQFGYPVPRKSYRSVLFDSAYMRAVQQIVDYVGTKKNVYVMISLWRDESFGPAMIPTLDDAAAPGSRCAALQTEGRATTSCVWRKLATAFARHPYVIYELVDEHGGNYKGEVDGTLWRLYNALAQVIRNVETAQKTPRHIIATQATRAWARSLEYYVSLDAQGKVTSWHPLTAGKGADIVYQAHPYGPIDAYAAWFINPSKLLPVMVGEMGPAFAADTQPETAKLTGDLMRPIQVLIDTCEARQIPYMAWALDSKCGPLSMTREDPKHLCTGLAPQSIQLQPWGSWYFRQMRRFENP